MSTNNSRNQNPIRRLVMPIAGISMLVFVLWVIFSSLISVVADYAGIVISAFVIAGGIGYAIWKAQGISGIHALIFHDNIRSFGRQGIRFVIAGLILWGSYYALEMLLFMLSRFLNMDFRHTLMLMIVLAPAWVSALLAIFSEEGSMLERIRLAFNRHITAIVLVMLLFTTVSYFRVPNWFFAADGTPNVALSQDGERIYWHVAYNDAGEPIEYDRVFGKRLKRPTPEDLEPFMKTPWDKYGKPVWNVAGTFTAATVEMANHKANLFAEQVEKDITEERKAVFPPEIEIVQINGKNPASGDPPPVLNVPIGEPVSIVFTTRHTPVGARIQFNYKVSDTDGWNSSWSSQRFIPVTDTPRITWNVPRDNSLVGKHITLHFGVISDDHVKGSPFLARTTIAVKAVEN